MQARYRALEEREVGEAADVFLTALYDMCRRNGLPEPTSYTRDYVEPRFAYLRRTGIFRVAEVQGRIVALCCAIVRGDVWFLSMFWALPGFQQRGIGKPLLAEVWQEGRDQGARVHFTWSSIEYAALGSYMKLGMLPVCQLFTFAGAPSELAAVPAGYTLEPLEPTTTSALDERVLGMVRDVDHEFWRASSQATYQVRGESGVVGYFYAGGGAIGPAAWSDEPHASAVIQLALREAKKQAPIVRLMTAALNRTAVRAALGSGLKIASMGHLLRTEEFGAFERYLPSGPALF